MQFEPRLPRPRRLVLFHGLASTPKEFGFLTHPLRRQGVTLTGLEVAGFSHGLLTEHPSWTDWIDSAWHEVKALRLTEPFVLGGLCTGSMLALAVASYKPLPGLQGVALMSPPVALDGWGLPWWYGLRKVAYALGISKHFSMAERAPFGLKNERMRQLVRKQIEAQGGDSSIRDGATVVGPARIPLTYVRESERLTAHGLNLLKQWNSPLLVQHAREDEICELSSVIHALRMVSRRLLTMKVLENSYHMISADNDRHLVAENTVAFMRGLLERPTHHISANTPTTHLRITQPVESI